MLRKTRFGKPCSTTGALPYQLPLSDICRPESQSLNANRVHFKISVRDGFPYWGLRGQARERPRF